MRPSDPHPKLHSFPTRRSSDLEEPPDPALGERASEGRGDPGAHRHAAAGREPVRAGVYQPGARSEEHTSELQSHHDLVCRLLLEKKKTRITRERTTYQDHTT